MFVFVDVVSVVDGGSVGTLVEWWRIKFVEEVRKCRPCFQFFPVLVGLVSSKWALGGSSPHLCEGFISSTNRLVYFQLLLLFCLFSSVLSLILLCSHALLLLLFTFCCCCLWWLLGLVSGLGGSVWGVYFSSILELVVVVVVKFLLLLSTFFQSVTISLVSG